MNTNLFPLRLNLQYFSADTGSGGEGNSQEQLPTPEPKSDTKKEESMIPKNRFDEVNGKYKELLEKVQSFEQAEAQRQKETEESQRKQAEEQGEFERLYKEAQTQIDSFKKFEQRTTELETVINSMVESKLEAVPSEMKELIPENLSPEQTLNWLNKAESKGLFGKKETPEIGKPMNHSTESPKVTKENMSALDKILSGLGGK